MSVLFCMTTNLIAKTIALLQDFYNKDCQRLVGPEKNYFLLEKTSEHSTELYGHYDNREDLTATLSITVFNDRIASKVLSETKLGDKLNNIPIFDTSYPLTSWQDAITDALVALDSVCLEK